MFNGIVIGGQRLDDVIAKMQQPTAADRPSARCLFKSNHRAAVTNLADQASLGETKACKIGLEVLADLDDLEYVEVLGRERVVELVRVDLEQDRGHSTGYSDTV